MKPIKRVPIVQQVSDRIRDTILNGTYPPGHKLPPELELRETLGVGRGTVREAFRLLEAQGFVEIKPGRGAFVSEHPTEDMGAVEWLIRNESELRDAIEVRRALEPLAARRMAERGSAADIHRLAALYENFMAALQSGDTALCGQLDEEFHSAIVAGSGNHLLHAINQQVTQGMKEFRSKTFQVPQNVRNAVEPHTNIMLAIRDRDGERAEREMRLHLDKVEEDLQSNVAERLEREADLA